jgi:hypothetical protein
MKLWKILTALALGGATALEAAPLDLKTVPAGSRWLVHLDVDGMRASPVVTKFYDETVANNPMVLQVLDRFAANWGMDPRKDLHGLTMFGEKIAPHHGVLVVRADVVLLASTVDRLKEALDVLDGKAPSLAGQDTPLAAEVPPGALVVVRAKDLQQADLPVKHPLLGLIHGLSYVKGQHDGRWFGRLMLAADAEADAQRMKTLLEGVRAAVQLHFRDAPEVQKLLDRATFTVDGKTVRAEIAVPVDELVAQIPQIVAHIKEHLMWKGRHDHHGMHKGCRPEEKHETPSQSRTERGEL